MIKLRKQEKNIIISVLISALVVLTVFCLVIPLINNVNAEEKTYSMSEVAFESTYDINEKIEFPKVVETFGEKQIKAVTIVNSPDGNSYKADEFVLSKAGKYTIDFLFSDGGKILKSESRSFVVYDNLYSFTNEASFATYDEELGGLNVKLAAGDTMTFNTVVDLSGYTAYDDLITFSVLPEVDGTLEFTTFSLILRDIYDESNHVEFLITYKGLDWTNYARAGHSVIGNTTGHEKTAWKDIIWTNDYGAVVQGFSFLGYGSEMKFSIDMETAEVFAGTGRTKIIDLNSPEYFAQLWEGFADNKVTMSLMVGGNLKSSASFLVKSLAGNVLNDTYANSEVDPIITINKEDMTDLNGVVGGTYKVPSVSAKLLNKTCDVYTSVYFNYYNEAKRINIGQKDSYFKTEFQGIYTIEYKSYNAFGGCVTKLVDIYVGDELPQATLSVSVTDSYRTGYKGTLIGLAEPVVSVPMEIKADTLITVEKDGKVYDVNDGYFYADENGKYRVTYSVIDHVGRKLVETYEIDVTTSQFGVIGEEPNLPDVFFSGYDYVVPSVEAFNYTTNAKAEAKARYKIDNGEWQNVELGGTMSIVCKDETGMLYLQYFVQNGNEIVFEHTITREIIRAYQDSFIDMAAYFRCTEGIDIVKAREYYTFIAEKDGNVIFIKEQAAVDFNLDFMFDNQKNNWTAFNLYMTDTLNPSERISVRFINLGNKFKLTIGETGEFTYDYQKITLLYSNTNFDFTFGNVKFNIPKTVYGEQFSGFSSSLVNFEMEFIGVDGEAAVNVSKFNGQALNSSVVNDYQRPRIMVLGAVGGKYVVGETMTVAEAIACDIFDPNIKLSLTVTDPSGNIVVSKDGIRLENVAATRTYDVELTQIGNYTVSYSAIGKYDFKAETINGRVGVKKVNEIPTMSLDGTIQKEANLGDTVHIPNGQSLDIDGEPLKVIRLIITPSLDRILLSSEYDSIVVNQKGTYTIVYYAVNSDGEPVSIRFTVEVK